MAKQNRPTNSHLNNIDLASEQEAKGNLKQAAKYYEAAIKDGRPDETPFNRLMVIYRKLKMPKDELRVIKTGIKVFVDFYRRDTPKPGRKKLADLSEAFMKSAGLQDKKGNLLYQPEPIGKWTKRKELLEKKLKG